MPFLIAVSVLLFILCGAVLADALGVGRRGDPRSGLLRITVAGIAIAPLIFWCALWIIGPRWNLAWEIASIAQGVLVLLNSALAFRVGPGWPEALRVSVRVVAIFTGTAFLALILRALLETLPAYFAAPGSP